MIQPKIAFANKKSYFHQLSLSAGLISAVLLSGAMLSSCASKPVPPTQALQAAALAIETAEQARVAEYASPELAEAREKLTLARVAVEKEDMVAAQRLAEQSRVDAELAVAKANAQKAKAVNDEMQKGISTLKQEMQRNTGVK